MACDSMLADPAVSRAKFEREIAAFRALEDEYRRRGWLLIEAEFPTAFFILTAAHVTPAPVVFGVEFDFCDYDLVPLGVTLVNPFTREPYLARELPSLLPRLVQPSGAPVKREELVALIQANGGSLPDGLSYLSQSLMIAHDPDQVPLLCLAGVRAYHEHPAHTGDAWFLHRQRGAGRLGTLLEHLHRFGARTVVGYNVQVRLQSSAGPLPDELQIQAAVTGLMVGAQPE